MTEIERNYELFSVKVLTKSGFVIKCKSPFNGDAYMGL